MMDKAGLEISMKKLRDLMEGATVVAVSPSEKREHIAKFTVKKEDLVREFHLGATELGWWISGESVLSGGEESPEIRQAEGEEKGLKTS